MRRFLPILLFTVALPGQKLLPGDPLEFELTPVRVKDSVQRKLSDYYDIVGHSLVTPGELNRDLKEPRPAGATNTLGEPLQGTWWMKRHYYRRMSLDELLAGPGKDHPPSAEGPWTVVGAKNEGVTPGFVMLDAKQQLYFIKFDPLSNPEMATGADHIAIRIVHALGYHVPENYLVEFPVDRLVLGKNVTLADRLGRRRPMSGRDLSELLQKVPKTKSGLYRATASHAIPGEALGPYRYYGTRSDDPNDFVPHEHRRDLRGLGVVSAWIGHDDSRAVNTYDALIQEGVNSFIRHYILDLGSTLGSGTQKANSARSGGEYLFSWKQSAVQLFTVGLAVPQWARADFPKIPSVGRFEYKRFDPVTWVPEYPNPAFLNRLPDDDFWAAKQIMAFRDEEIREIVTSARYSDPKAQEWITECLIRRRDKVGRAFYAKVLPIDRFSINQGSITFEDLAETAGFGAAGPYRIHWLEFDPRSGATNPIPDASTKTVPRTGGEYVVARITSDTRPKQSVDVTIRRGTQAEVVAIERRW